MRILCATGLRREAQILSQAGVVALPGGGDSAGLERALAAAAAARADGVISIGLGGALAPGLKPGDWVVAREVLFEDERLTTDPAWTEALRERLPSPAAGAILGSERMVTEAADKQAAHARTGALAVDMESQTAARVARRFGLRFAAARVISDAADRSLPAAVKVGMRPDGGMALGAVLLALAKDPAQLPALIRTGREAGVAFRALADGNRLLGPGLGLADLLELPLDVG